MKKFILILLCFFVVNSYAQQKNGVSKKENTITVKKKTNTPKKTTAVYKICGLCKGTGKDPYCKGTGVCQNHHPSSFMDKKCYENCTDTCNDFSISEEEFNVCESECRNDCTENQLCDSCDSYDGRCLKRWCNNGVCRNCNGSGKK